MEKTLIAATKGLTLLALVVIIFYFTNIGLYKEIIKEDGIIENLTAILLLTMSIFVLIKVIKSWKKKGGLWIVFNIFLLSGLFFGFGEETSWGQSVFNTTPSGFFVENNTQKETNIHNLVINGVKVNKWIFSYLFSVCFGVYFFLLSLAYKKASIVKKYVDKLGVPLPKNKQVIAFVLVTLLILTIPEEDKWELWEYLFVVTFLSILTEPYNSDEKLFPTKNNTH
ncbi:MAG: hypothetical protein O2810_04090 [Bacteroidetes bacterium]|nr:hypothetical protein [Bacteroidota bacterium]